MTFPLDLDDLKDRAARGDKHIDPCEVAELIERYETLARQATTLYGLIHVESQMAGEMPGDYPAARKASYEFVLTAMQDRRWHLPFDQWVPA